MPLYSPGTFEISIAPPGPYAQEKLLTKLSEFSRELQNLQTAASDMRNGVSRKDLKLLTGGVTNSLNWLLSLVETQSYIQSLLYDGDGVSPFAHGDFLYARGAKLGAQRGVSDRQLAKQHAMTI